MKSQTITVFIDAPVERVYAFASNPENLPRWVPSFFRSIRRDHEAWIVDSPLGEACFSFVAINSFGVLDHHIRLPSGLEFYNPMRVIANGTGSEIMLTLFQTAAMSETDFARDAAAVRNDLELLKGLLEVEAD